MSEPSKTEQPEKDTKIRIINTVKTPLGFFVLVVLIVEVVFGISASMSSGNDKTYLIVGMLALVFLLVLIVAGMAFFRPSSLYGVSTQPTEHITSLGQHTPQDKGEMLIDSVAAELSEFFGSDILTDEFKIVYGMYSRISQDEPLDKRAKVYQKIYSNREVYEMWAPRLITTQDTIRGLSYFLQEFSRYREKPFIICTDDEALPFYHNSTFLSIGGPLTNELSDLALKEENNKFFRFSISPKLELLPSVESISDSRRFERGSEIGHDYGIIVKVKNSRASGRYLFVCAGIGALGTSAAVWYLSNSWRQLHQKFGAKEFGVVVEVVRGQDNMATCVYSMST